MLIYLLIGVIVEMCVVTIRVKIRKVASFKNWSMFTWLSFALMCVFNILIWPVTVITEVINTKNGV